MNAKQNLKRYLNEMNISPAQFYRDSGLSNGFLNQGDNISSNNIEIIISIYPNLNLSWLITGNGDMLNTLNHSDKNGNLNGNPNGNLLQNSEDSSQHPSTALGSIMESKNANSLSIYKESEVEEKPPRQDSGSNELVMHLVEQIKEQSEEIGALKQEVRSLKNRLAQYAEAAQDAQSARA